jgi:hypothetical protein
MLRYAPSYAQPVESKRWRSAFLGCTHRHGILHMTYHAGSVWHKQKGVLIQALLDQLFNWLATMSVPTSIYLHLPVARM